jgi:hypothetical protein
MCAHILYYHLCCYSVACLYTSFHCINDIWSVLMNFKTPYQFIASAPLAAGAAADDGN